MSNQTSQTRKSKRKILHVINHKSFTTRKITASSLHLSCFSHPPRTPRSLWFHFCLHPSLSHSSPASLSLYCVYILYIKRDRDFWSQWDFLVKYTQKYLSSIHPPPFPLSLHSLYTVAGCGCVTSSQCCYSTWKHEPLPGVMETLPHILLSVLLLKGNGWQRYKVPCCFCKFAC